jgi:hypothetical protein
VPDEHHAAAESGGIPRFTNAEVLEAFAAVMPPAQVDALRQAIGAKPREQSRVAITDTFYLVLAALSPEYAGRIVRSRPDLADAVADVQRDPRRYIEDRRAAAAEEAEG